MLEFLKGIDTILESRLVRWALLISFCLSIVCLLWVYLLNQTYKIETALLRSQKATLEAHVDVQNNAIKKAEQDYALNKKRLDGATAKANALEKQRKELPLLSGTCEQMVRQIMDTIVSIKD